MTRPFTKLVYVEWVDSRRIGEGWLTLDEVTSENLGCCTVGWIKEESKKSIILVMNVSDEPITCLHCLEIPRCAITKIKRLKIPQ